MSIPKFPFTTILAKGIEQIIQFTADDPTPTPRRWDYKKERKKVMLISVYHKVSSDISDTDSGYKESQC